MPGDREQRLKNHAPEKAKPERGPGRTPTQEVVLGTQLDVNPERIAQHAKEITNSVRPELDKGFQELNSAGTIEGGDFSITATMAAMAYPMALQWAFEDFQTHLDMLDGYARKLEATAVTYGSAETASTIQKV